MELKDAKLIHLAFSRSSGADAIEESIALLMRITKKAKELGIKSLIYLSSQSVYDPERKFPAKEDDLPSPTTLYAVAKLFGEEWLNAYAKEQNLAIVHLRLASLIGPGFEQRLTTRLLKRAVDEGEIKITSGEEVLSYLSVEDAADAIVQLLFSEINTGVYNLGTDEKYSLLEMARTINKVLVETGLNEAIIHFNEKKPPFPNNSLLIDKFKKDFHWEARRSLKDCLHQDLERLIALDNEVTT